MALADFDSIRNCHPFVTKSYIISNQKQGVGALRQCKVSFFRVLTNEKAIEWNAEKNIKTETIKLNMITGIMFFQQNLSIREFGSKNSIVR